MTAPRVLTLTEAAGLIGDAAAPRRLEVVAGFGGLDIDMIAASGCARTIIAAFVGSELIPSLPPGLQRALDLGIVDVMQIDEGILLAAMRAAAQQVPFTTWTGGLGTSATDNRLCSEQVDDKTGRRFVRVEPLRLDACAVWAEAADEQGNVLLWGPDFGDPTMLAASELRIVQVERLAATGEIARYPDRVLPWSADVIIPVKSGTFPFGGTGLSPDARWLRHYACRMREITPTADADELRSFLWKTLEIPAGFDAFRRSAAAGVAGGGDG
jgi:glutaconate CoA-transferase, subunit A